MSILGIKFDDSPEWILHTSTTWNFRTFKQLQTYLVFLNSFFKVFGPVMSILEIVTTAVRAALTWNGEMSEEDLLTAIGELDLGQYVGALGERPEEAMKPVEDVAKPVEDVAKPEAVKAVKAVKVVKAVKSPKKVVKATHVEGALLPMDVTRCHSRKWNLGFGCQCMGIPIDGTLFCKNPKHDEEWKFGRYDEAKPDDHKWKDPLGGEPVKKVKKAPKSPKAKKAKKEVTPEVKEAKERYELLHGKKPRGKKAGDLAWLEEKNAAKAEADGEGEKAVPDAPDAPDAPDDVVEVDIAEEKAKLVSDKLKEIEELDPDLELEEDQCMEDWEYQGVPYTLDMVTNRVLDENNDLIGVRNEAGEIDFATTEARNRHEEACDEEDEPESDEEAEDGDA